MDVGPAMSSAHQDARAWYVIRVRGPLDAVWSSWFEGFTITPAPTGDTIFSGEVVDQSAFHGVINRMRDLGLTIISVERREPQGERGHPQ